MSAVTIDLTDPTPPFEQLRRQFALLIETGQLAHGERLPSVRQLARDLGLAPGTVGRAYQELESAGLVRTRRGGGTTVSPTPRHTTKVAANHLAEAAWEYAARTVALGLTKADAVAALEAAWPSRP